MPEYLVKSEEDAILVENVLKKYKISTCDIKISNDYKFLVYLPNEIDINMFKKTKVIEDVSLILTTSKKPKIRQEDVFDINLFKVLNSFKILKEFENLKFELVLRSPTTVEAEIKDKMSCTECDAIFRISKKKMDDPNYVVAEIVLEYDEYESHNNAAIKLNDKNKKIQGEHYCDEYFDYQQKKVESVDRKSYFAFFNDLIVTIFKYSCTLADDSSTLCKILYFKTYSGKNIKRDTTILNNLLTYKQEDSVNMEKIYEDFNISKKFKKYSIFEEYLCDECELKIKNKKCDFNNFSLFVIKCDNTMSNLLAVYKCMYVAAMDKLLEASGEIILLLTKNMKKKSKIPKLINSYVSNDVFKNKDKSIIIDMFDTMPVNQQYCKMFCDKIEKSDPDNLIYISNELNKIVSNYQNFLKTESDESDFGLSDSDSDSDSSSEDEPENEKPQKIIKKIILD
jgi:hypothetical protein